VGTRRRDYAAGGLTPDRIAELEAIPGWAWNQLEEQWATSVAAVRDYATENGHARVPQRYCSPTGHGTGHWVSKRRGDYAAGGLTPDQIAELEALPGWVWNPHDEQWSAGLAAVHAYAAENGHARVPARYVSPDGHRTGNWVGTRRRDYAAGGLTPDRIAELEAIPGWSWNMFDEKWYSGLAAVRAHATENGHANVPQRYVSSDGHKTGRWVRSRRGDYAAGRLTPDQIAELEAIPGWVWRVNDTKR
jgi:hypothetical protein